MIYTNNTLAPMTEQDWIEISQFTL